EPASKPSEARCWWVERARWRRKLWACSISSGVRGRCLLACFAVFAIFARAASTTPSADHPADEASAPLLKPGGELNPATPPIQEGNFWNSVAASVLLSPFAILSPFASSKGDQMCSERLT